MNPAGAALILREADVQRLCEMPDVVGWVEEATRAHGRAQARNPPRQRVNLPQGTLHVLPSADLEAGVVSLKVYTSYKEATRFLILTVWRVVVDSRQQARLECGDLLIPAERGWIDLELLPELREVVAGHSPGRQSPDEITIFESHGLGLQDVAVAAQVYRRAVEGGCGAAAPALPGGVTN